MNAHAALRAEVTALDRLASDTEQACEELKSRFEWHQTALGWRNAFIAPDGTRHTYDWCEALGAWILRTNDSLVGDFTETPEEMLERLEDEMEMA